jgi:clan AA aspartic protease
MGVTYIDGVVSGPTGRERSVHFLVDSGATYSLLPHDVWTELGLTKRRAMRFSLADGSQMERDISECHVSLDALGETHTPVILGEPGDQPLLGAVTLEELGLVLNPFTRQLHPMRMLLV